MAESEAPRMIDAVHWNNTAAEGIQRELLKLADAFFATGNEKVAERLTVIANDIVALAKMVDRSFAKDLTEQVSRSTEASHNMIRAAIAVATAGGGNG